jgi:hypothetical protein
LQALKTDSKVSPAAGNFTPSYKDATGGLQPMEEKGISFSNFKAGKLLSPNILNPYKK